MAKSLTAETIADDTPDDNLDELRAKIARIETRNNNIDTSAKLGDAACNPSLSPGTPTVTNPDRIGYCPVMKDARPAVQLAI